MTKYFQNYNETAFYYRATGPLFDRVNRWIRTSIMLKIAVVGFLILLLLIPTNMLQSLISEREMTRNNAVTEADEAEWTDSCSRYRGLRYASAIKNGVQADIHLLVRVNCALCFFGPMHVGQWPADHR